MWRKAWTGGAGAFSRWPPCPSLSVSRPHGARPNCLALDTKRPGCEPSGTVMDGGCHGPLCTKTPPAHFVGCAPCTCFPSASTIDQILTFLVSPVVCGTDHRVWQQGLVVSAGSRGQTIMLDSVLLACSVFLSCYRNPTLKLSLHYFAQQKARGHCRALVGWRRDWRPLASSGACRHHIPNTS